MVHSELKISLDLTSRNKKLSCEVILSNPKTVFGEELILNKPEIMKNIKEIFKIMKKQYENKDYQTMYNEFYLQDIPGEEFLQEINS